MSAASTPHPHVTGVPITALPPQLNPTQLHFCNTIHYLYPNHTHTTSTNQPPTQLTSTLHSTYLHTHTPPTPYLCHHQCLNHIPTPHRHPSHIQLSAHPQPVHILPKPHLHSTYGPSMSHPHPNYPSSTPHPHTDYTHICLSITHPHPTCIPVIPNILFWFTQVQEQH